MFISIVFSNDRLYYLAKNGIYSSNFNFEVEKVYNLNDTDNFSEFETDNENLFFIKNTYSFAKYNILNNQLITYDNILKFDKNNEFTNNRNLKSLNNLLILQPTRSNQSSNILLSSDKGQTWNKIFDYHKNFSTYCINGNNLDFFYLNYSIITEIYPKIKTTNYNYLIYPTLIQYTISTKTEKLFTDTEKFSSLDSILLTSYPLSEPITHLEKVSDETYIAIGKNMSIFISNDGGRNWRTISNFAQYMYYNINQNTRLSKPILLDNKKMFFNYFSGIIHNTYNAGITWLPQKIKLNDLKRLPISSFKQYHFNDNNGILFYGDTNFVSTDDYAKSLNYDKSITNIGISSIGQVTSNYKGLETFENILFISQYYYKNIRSKILIFDKSYNFKDSVVFDSTIVKEVFKDDKNNLYSLCFKQSIKDTTFEKDTLTRIKNIDYFVIKSTDNGYSWNKLDSKLPLISGKKYIEEKERFVEVDSYKAQYKYKNFILFPNTWDSTNVMFTFDCNSEKFDSLHLPAELNRINIYDNMFEHRNRLYFVSTDAVMYYTEDIGKENILWDSIDITKYFNNWIKRDYGELTFDAVYSVYPVENQLYFTITKMPKNFSEESFPIMLNLVRFYKDDFILDIEDTEIRNYLYSYPPYPIPAKTQVNTIIYWDKNIEFSKESIKIYDINGMEVGRQEDITIEQETAYKGRLIWNCASVPDGVYLIHVKHGNNAQTIKVIVNK